jgi:hypothetical protein
VKVVAEGRSILAESRRKYLGEGNMKYTISYSRTNSRARNPVTGTVINVVEATDDTAVCWYAEAFLLQLNRSTWEKVNVKIVDETGRVVLDLSPEVT